MILFHGTSTYYKARIAKDHQLKPCGRRRKGNYTGDLTSDPECVYLTDVYAPAFARITVDRKGGRPLILKVEVDESLIEPDTDFIAEGGHRLEFTDGLECLKQTGCCAVRGSVDVIKGFIPYKEIWDQCLEATLRICTGFRHHGFKQQHEDLLNTLLWHSDDTFI